jgi:glycolate oxidase FAD binding subunit
LTEFLDISAYLQERVSAAAEVGKPLCIRAGGSKDFYGREPQGEVLDVSGHRGIISYEPTELVITARAGTPLSEINQALAEQQQILPFEPPSFGDEATLGGTIACNLSGPRRPYAGAARDLVLGMKVLNGKGEILTFGGEVMKNVAGYDVSRLMAGAMGTLGVILEVSVKVLPRPESEITLVHEGLSTVSALEKLHAWGRLPLPISASCVYEDQLLVRICGSPKAIRAARNKIGGEEDRDRHAQEYWNRLTNQRHGFFEQRASLWRLSVASDASPLNLAGDWLYEWGGALRWLSSEAATEEIRSAAASVGGHATLYRNGDQRQEVFHPLSSGLMKIHKQLKRAFDPRGILNPGRMYSGL